MSEPQLKVRVRFSSCGAVAPAGLDVAEPADPPPVLLTVGQGAEQALVEAGEVARSEG